VFSLIFCPFASGSGVVSVGVVPQAIRKNGRLQRSPQRKSFLKFIGKKRVDKIKYLGGR
jgi:hypothetical protein